MQGFNPITAHRRPTRILSRQIRNRKIPQALLFTGIDGIGKSQLAIRLAMCLNCSRPPAGGSFSPDPSLLPARGGQFPVCNTCPACKKVLAGNHPDILIIESAGRAIKIDQIRTLRDTMGLRPYEASRRVAIIKDAHLMTLPASNALLKLLEEPPVRTAIILIAAKSANLIATIVSRCQQIKFEPIADDLIIDSLQKRLENDPERTHIIAAMAGGSLKISLKMVSETWWQQRNWILGELNSLCRAAAAKRKSSLRQTMALAERLASDRPAMERLLIVIKSWFRDIAIWPFRPDTLINLDRSQEIKVLARQLNPGSVIGAFDAMDTLEKQMTTNANLRLASETTFNGLIKQLARST